MSDNLASKHRERTVWFLERMNGDNPVKENNPDIRNWTPLLDKDNRFAHRYTGTSDVAYAFLTTRGTRRTMYSRLQLVDKRYSVVEDEKEKDAGHLSGLMTKNDTEHGRYREYDMSRDSNVAGYVCTIEAESGSWDTDSLAHSVLSTVLQQLGCAASVEAGEATPAGGAGAPADAYGDVDAATQYYDAGDYEGASAVTSDTLSAFKNAEVF